jgi:hypothetical protein
MLHDLGIDGDDAAGLLTEFAEAFSVDMSSFPFSRYFGSEAGAGYRWLVRKIRGGDAVAFPPVTVEDLTDAANRGRWVTTDRKT